MNSLRYKPLKLLVGVLAPGLATCRAGGVAVDGGPTDCDVATLVDKEPSLCGISILKRLPGAEAASSGSGPAGKHLLPVAKKRCMVSGFEIVEHLVPRRLILGVQGISSCEPLPRRLSFGDPC